MLKFTKDNSPESATQETITRRRRLSPMTTSPGKVLRLNMFQAGRRQELASADGSRVSRATLDGS